MSVFLTKIQINKILHLEDVSIEIDSEEKKHLILTGKNGSGKTSLLNNLVNVFQEIKNGRANLPSLLSLINGFERSIEENNEWGDVKGVKKAENEISQIKKEIRLDSDSLTINFNDLQQLSHKLIQQDFLLGYYTATRKTQVEIPKTPEKPNLNPANEINESKIGEFLKFLVDLKIQEALARNENQGAAADEVKIWFENFTVILRKVFENEKVTLDFNYKDYSFTINLDGRKFGFNELSDGYSAIIDIVADLIIKMQAQNSLTRAYEKEGIVLIDEVETHLHLKLQRLILPMLTQIFPNIQFIASTHSPFVLNSLPNAVAYDLEKRTRLEDLTEYSYEALAEGYFKVETDSSYLLNKLNRFEELSKIKKKDAAELEEYENLDEEFASLDETLTSPAVKGQYLQIKLSEK